MLTLGLSSVIVDNSISNGTGPGVRVEGGPVHKVEVRLASVRVGSDFRLLKSETTKVRDH